VSFDDRVHDHRAARRRCCPAPGDQVRQSE
jgi:hypothetical protein